MPRAKNQLRILAGTTGIFAPDPELFGPVVVEPIFPGSFQAKRQGYRWVCRTASGDIVFIPFRNFTILGEETPQNTEKYLTDSPKAVS